MQLSRTARSTKPRYKHAINPVNTGRYSVTQTIKLPKIILPLHYTTEASGVFEVFTVLPGNVVSVMIFACHDGPA
ncbi:hypothetical protein A0H81_09361 [Grifola frondosa]|uniref:Uncharacterized protein n=1 Tax=Grifola frondosa TaxID=5627 RepID=A0A1C7M779_GRIFR|nr:hypothetical protein A0H81_09361 [Grifola frondosa]